MAARRGAAICYIWRICGSRGGVVLEGRPWSLARVLAGDRNSRVKLRWSREQLSVLLGATASSS